MSVLQAVTGALLDGKEEGTIVIIEDLTFDQQREGVWEFDAGDNFLEHGAEEQERTHRGAEIGVFGLESRQGNLTLKVRLPQVRTSAKSDDVSCSRLCGGRRTIWVAPMKACEVGVDVTVEIHVACGFYNHYHVTSAVQQVDESLDGGDRDTSFVCGRIWRLD